ncbi:MAG: hypothetical protein AB7F32_04495 [Victivallaceae bacterium]
MQKSRILLLGALFALLLAGCRTAKLSSEDVEVPELYRKEIAILHSDAPPNSEAKYLAAKRLNDNLDFYFTRDVSTLDKIFSSADARVDVQNATDQMIMFYYQYKDRSIRFCFYRFGDDITKVEIFEK